MVASSQPIPTSACPHLPCHPCCVHEVQCSYQELAGLQDAPSPPGHPLCLSQQLHILHNSSSSTLLLHATQFELEAKFVLPVGPDSPLKRVERRPLMQEALLPTLTLLFLLVEQWIYRFQSGKRFKNSNKLKLVRVDG